MLLKSRFVIVTHMMLALCTAVTLRRPFSLARRKAYSAILRELLLVIILRLSTTPETLWKKEKWRTIERQTLLTCSYKFLCFGAWPRVPDCCTLPLCSPWWSWCQCSYGESGLQGGTGSASRWQTSLSLCLCENAKQKQWLMLQQRPNSGIRILKSIQNSYRRMLFLDLTDGGIVCLVSMLPVVGVK